MCRQDPLSMVKWMLLFYLFHKCTRGAARSSFQKVGFGVHFRRVVGKYVMLMSEIEVRFIFIY